MIKVFRENFVLKLIALATSIMIWFYVSSERTPIISRQVNAEVVLIGKAPDNVIVRVRPQGCPVEVSGPRSEVESINESDVKAIVNQRSARPGVSQLAILRYEPPSTARNITFKELKHLISADVFEKQIKPFRIEPSYDDAAPFGRKYSPAKLVPARAEITGIKEDIQRVAKLVVNIETRGGSVRDDLIVHALDKDGVLVEGVGIDPIKTHVELNLVEAPATRTLLVSVAHTGRVPGPYELVALMPEPNQVTVVGKPEILAQMTNVSTIPVNVEGLTTEITREVPLQLPSNVTLQDGSGIVKVTIRVRDISHPTP